MRGSYVSVITLFVAIGGCLVAPQYMAAPTPDLASIKKFLA